MAKKSKPESHSRTSAHMPAKLTCPVVEHGYPRARLFQQLDKARERPVVWITGPAGAGKTTLAASYLSARSLQAVWYRLDVGDGDIASFFYHLGLASKATSGRSKKALPLFTREYLSGLPVFAANYFRQLFAHLRRPCVLVFDNFHDIADSAHVQEVLRKAFDEITPDFNIFVLSRSDPPPAFARARATGRLMALGWDDLKLTREESAGILRLRHRGPVLPDAFVETLHRATQGWAAGVVLAAERAMRNRHLDVGHEIPVTMTQEVFDYFASEIFCHSETKVQTFLQHTAFLPKVSVPAAQVLGEAGNARAILDELSRRNLFTVRHADGSYEYHPLFRAFLLARATQVYTAEHVRDLQVRAAELLVERGEVESAVELLQQAHEWQASLQLILREAPSLYAQGRTQTLEAWIVAFPELFRQQNPWLCYWRGMCRLAYAPAQARESLEQAFAMFERGTESGPLYMTWSGIVDSFVLERNDFTPLRKWLDLYPALRRDRVAPPAEIEMTSMASYVTALINHRFDHPELPHFVERIEALLAAEQNEDRRFLWIATLIPFYLWRGDIPNIARLTQRLDPGTQSPAAKPLIRLCWYMWKILETSALGSTDESLQLMQAGLALAEASGIHAVDMQMQGYGILAHVYVGNIEGASLLLGRMNAAPQRGVIADGFRSHFSSIVHLHRGELPRALADGRMASRLSKATGLFLGEVSHTIELAYVYVRQGDFAAAERILEEMAPMVERMESKPYASYIALCQANIHRLRGDDYEMLQALRIGLGAAADSSCMVCPFCPRDDAARLLALALEAGIEPDYARSLIAKMKLLPPPDMLSIHWPWPVRIQTLGRFAVVKNGAALTVGERAGRKPLELLRALTMFGGRDVSVTKLAQILWPEADGDLAHQSMEVTLHRLRKLIGERYILRQENLLSLDSNLCWLDTRAFEQYVENAESGQGAPQPKADALMGLYRGSFLPEDEAPAAIIERERLRAKFVRALIGLGRMLEDANRLDDAVTCYERALEREPLVEELYGRLIHCHQLRNRRAEAVAVYRRCKNTMTAAFGTVPSAALQKLVNDLQA